MILKAYKYRLYPNKEQEILFVKHFGCVRFIYNWGLNKKNEAYQKEKRSLSYYHLKKELPIMKKTEDFYWLKEVNSQSLQSSLEHLDQAFTKFFREKKGFPKFKKKHGKQSFHVPQNTIVDWDNNRVSLPKIENIKIVLHRKFEGKIKTSVISKTKTGKYFISILVETPDILPNKPKLNIKKAMGIDVGLKHFITLSTGEKIGNPKFLSNSLKRLKVLQRRLSRKKKGGKNREKAKLQVVKLHEKITNQRGDFLHKVSYRLTHDKQVDTVCFETLNIKGMMQNHTLAQAISDVAWSKFIQFNTYKSDWYGKNILFIGRFEPSSKMCSCGEINNELKLSNRIWTCKKCKITHDRDKLSANNIKKFAFQKQNLIITGRDTPRELAELWCSNAKH